MKKFTFVLSVLVLASLVLTACAPKTTTESGNHMAGLPDLGGKTITVAVENAYPPFNTIDATSGAGVGWDYDAVREICKRINCVPDFKQAAWDGIFPAMAAGEYDMLADGVTFTMDRAWTVDFSIPYVIIGQVLLTRAAETRMLADFKSDPSLKIGTQIGTTNEIVAKATFADREIQSFEDFGAAVLALIAGDIDAVVIDNVSATGYIQENAGKIKIADQITSDEMLAFVFTPGSDLLQPVNAALRSMHKDLTLDQINKKWSLSK
ncbi:MAG TPA: transporter substrate-binding domain-containing protein [Anaerolineales bacterium]